MRNAGYNIISRNLIHPFLSLSLMTSTRDECFLNRIKIQVNPHISQVELMLRASMPRKER